MVNPFVPGGAPAFFWEHAGWGWNPATETEAEGRRRGALRLAEAEARACAAGVSFAWDIDPDIDSSDWSDDPDPWDQWQLIVHAPDGEVLTSLGGVDFGRDGEPWGNPYRRVCEAECALEVLDQLAVLEVAV